MDERLNNAAQAGDISAMYKLLSLDPFLFENMDGFPFAQTPLHIAALAGQTSFVMELLNLKPSFIRKLNTDGYSPVHLACLEGRIKMVREILEFDHELGLIKGKEWRTPLHCAVINGRVDVVGEFLSACSPDCLRALTVRKETVLHLALKYDQIEVFEVLVERFKAQNGEAIVNWKDNEGNTILHLATYRKQFQIVSDLLSLPDTNVNALNRDHKTTLDIAEDLPFSEESTDIRECLAHFGAVRANELNQPRDELRKTVTQIKKDVHIQLKQTRRTNKNVSGIGKELKRLHREEINNATNSVTVVAVLFATVAFAANFTVPGGDDETGVAVMVSRPAFQIFFIFNAISLFTSLAVVVVQMTIVRGETRTERRVIQVISKLMWLASVATTVAFISSSYIVLGRHYQWAAIFITVVGGVTMVGVLGIATYYVVKSERKWSVRKKEKLRKSMSNSWRHSEMSDSDINPIYAI